MRKRLGQNFLINPAFRRRLAEALEFSPGEDVWEIGPGLGAMTGELLAAGALVRAFEIDPGFAAYLQEEFGGRPGFTLVQGDVLKTWKGEKAAPYLLGNLPYNIAAVLLGDLIEGKRLFKRLVVTVQKEVGRRMIARPGQDDYSSFSVLIAGVYQVRALMTMGGSAFYPPPRVDSLGLRLDLRAEAPADIPSDASAGGPASALACARPPSLPPLFYPLVRRLFSARRKTLKNSLCSFVASYGIIRGQMPKELAMAALEGCGIRPEERPENLDIPQFRALALALQQLGVGD
jgi:16S rRNA (adenine1518-N6/adenine1519-N6)-dimethyltransferase